ncbi:hypothetical protein DSO57_1023059 [Entomophthora muscae]|uniref:Uncharacterized protein n=1 Tax=Entomophthora muscae TaxID=34485 RepID=A0ACC2S533_9FUNG|nr:hypothetical protein DSO57_1023059 [Entomophthora muscae]
MMGIRMTKDIKANRADISSCESVKVTVVMTYSVEEYLRVSPVGAGVPLLATEFVLAPPLMPVGVEGVLGFGLGTFSPVTNSASNIFHPIYIDLKPRDQNKPMSRQVVVTNMEHKLSRYKDLT